VALVALAKMASDDGRAQEGIALLERARDKNPRAVQPRLILANYQLRRGNAAEALTLAREAYDISPRLPAAALLLGRAQIANGMTDDAISSLSELAERYPNSVDTHMQLALAAIPWRPWAWAISPCARESSTRRRKLPGSCSRVSRNPPPDSASRVTS
jgi:Flp pilus assembly protein TadD